MLLARPLLSDALARAVAEHRQANDRLRHMTQLTMTPAPGRATAIAARIRTLFRLS